MYCALKSKCTEDEGKLVVSQMLSSFVSWLAGAYFVSLAMTIIYGKLVYGFLNGVHPNQSLTHPPGVYQQYATYRQFLDISIISFIVRCLDSSFGIDEKKLSSWNRCAGCWYCHYYFGLLGAAQDLLPGD